MPSADAPTCPPDQSSHNRALILSTLAWTALFVLVDKAQLHGWLTSTPLVLLAIALHAALGAGVVWVFLRLLASLDDLQRKIQIDALAVGFGAGLFGSFSYHLLVTWGFVTDVEMSDIILLMTGAYVTAYVVGMLRYR